MKDWLNALKNWLSALLSQTIISALWILSTLSTMATFYFPELSGKARVLSAISAGVAFAWANFRVFQKQQGELSQLRQNVAAHESRRSQLKITADSGSRYILAPIGEMRNADFRGGYIELRLMIENMGRRNSVVNRYDLDIVELRQSFANLRPMEGQHGVQGRHCHNGLYAAAILSKTGNITIEAETATNHGTLLFGVPEINMDDFLTAGLRMQGSERKFGDLTCRLTLTDTTGSSATQEFQLREE